MTARITYIVILAMNLPAYASGQSVLNQGERVRIHQLNGTVVTGIVQSATPQAVRLLGEAGGTEFVIPRGEVGEIERSLGRHRKFGRNLTITVVSSAVAIGGISAISWSPCTGLCLFHPTSRGEAFAFGLLAGGAIIGTPIGIIVGLAARHERWEQVSFAGQGQAALSIQPILGRGFGVSASLAFGGR
jgi:hypothetical protein